MAFGTGGAEAPVFAGAVAVRLVVAADFFAGVGFFADVDFLADADFFAAAGDFFDTGAALLVAREVGAARFFGVTAFFFTAAGVRVALGLVFFFAGAVLVAGFFCASPVSIGTTASTVQASRTPTMSAFRMQFRNNPTNDTTTIP
jgi:hypothetical protein